MAKYNLKGLHLDEISLVDNPANQHAMVSIFKRSDPDNPASAGSPGVTSVAKEGQMDPKLEKKLGELESQVETLKAERDEAVAKAETAEAEKAEAVAKAEEAEKVEKAEDDFIDIDGEKVAKSAVPAPLLKRMEAQQAAIEKMQADAEKVELRKRAEDELPNLAGTADQKGALLKALDGLDDADRDELMKGLKAADAAVSKLFAEVGKSADDETSAEARLNKMAKDYAAEKSVPFETAFAEVIKTRDGAELRKAAESERN